jgi:hypothetical protein
MSGIVRHGGMTFRFSFAFVAFFQVGWTFLEPRMALILLLSLACHVKSLSSTAISLGMMEEEQTRSVSTCKSTTFK